MTRIALKSLASRKRRTATTIFAVFIGIALVAGTYVLTDTINKAFDEIFSDSLKGTDVVITASNPVRQDSGVTPSFSAKILKDVKGVDGVKLAAGAIFTQGALFDAGGKTIGAEFSPKFISSVLPGPLEALDYKEGRAPQTGDEAALDNQAAADGGIAVGDTVKVAGATRSKDFTVVGITQLGDTSFGGATITKLTLPESQRITQKGGQFDQISIKAAAGVNPAALKARIMKVTPKSVQVETASENADRMTKEIANDLSFLKIGLLVFAFVALIVGSFLIFNTFSITIAQRVTEFGMLRTLGASRRQILATVIVESLLIGIIGSVLGLAGGLAFAPAIKAIFTAIGADLPTTSAVLASRTIIVSLALGTIVTLVSSLLPALRATRVAPIAALRQADLEGTGKRSRKAAASIGFLALLGLVLTCYGLFGGLKSGSSAASLIGAGSFAILFAVSLFSPTLVAPIASMVGRPLEKVRGLTARLARENSQRKPGRTAATAAALMIGLALVTFVSIFAAGFKSTISAAIDRNFQGELEIQNSDGFTPIPAALASTVAGVDGVKTISSLRYSQAKIGGVSGAQRFSGLDPATATDVFSFEWADGSDATLKGLTDSTAIVDRAFADSDGVAVGDTIQVLTTNGQRPSFKIVGSVKDNANLLGSIVITQTAMRKSFATKDDSLDLIKLDDGADAEAVKTEISKLIKEPFPTAKAFNQTELKQNQQAQITPLLGLVYALLSLAVIISLFGIGNTLSLSIHERTRELGMLRAVGMSRKQVKQMIRYESVITALIGAVLGLALGVLFALLISRPLADEGFILSFPIPTLIAIAALAAVAGVLAAIGPARRAAKLDVLEAVSYE